MLINQATRSLRANLGKRMLLRASAASPQLSPGSFENFTSTVAPQHRAFATNKQTNKDSRTFSTADATAVKDKIINPDMFCRQCEQSKYHSLNCYNFSSFYDAINRH